MVNIADLKQCVEKIFFFFSLFKKKKIKKEKIMLAGKIFVKQILLAKK